ncbi:MAG: GNAT family N-acetyltransferase [Gaiellaceae bacterium]
MTVEIRRAEPADYSRVIAVLDEWWGGRPMREMLPRLFFVHFADTSFVAERDGALSGFLVGFLSQSEPDEAYVHFVGVNPDVRGTGLGRELYERFFAVARAHGRGRVSCVTSPANTGSLAFHRAIGFAAGPPRAGYDGPGEDRVVLTRSLAR